jgi:hypothetical protein
MERRTTTSWHAWPAVRQGDLPEFRGETLEFCGYSEHRGLCQVCSLMVLRRASNLASKIKHLSKQARMGCSVEMRREPT